MKDNAGNKSILAVAAILVAASMASAKFPSFDIGHSSHQVLATSSFADGVACGRSHRAINPTATISPCLDWSFAGW